MQEVPDAHKSWHEELSDGLRRIHIAGTALLADGEDDGGKTGEVVGLSEEEVEARERDLVQCLDRAEPLIRQLAGVLDPDRPGSSGARSAQAKAHQHGSSGEDVCDTLLTRCTDELSPLLFHEDVGAAVRFRVCTNLAQVLLASWARTGSGSGGNGAAAGAPGQTTATRVHLLCESCVSLAMLMDDARAEDLCVETGALDISMAVIRRITAAMRRHVEDLANHRPDAGVPPLEALRGAVAVLRKATTSPEQKRRLIALGAIHVGTELVTTAVSHVHIRTQQNGPSDLGNRAESAQDVVLASILQDTVKHLRSLSSKGSNLDELREQRTVPALCAMLYPFRHNPQLMYVSGRLLAQLSQRDAFRGQINRNVSYMRSMLRVIAAQAKLVESERRRTRNSSHTSGAVERTKPHQQSQLQETQADVAIATIGWMAFVLANLAKKNDEVRETLAQPEVGGIPVLLAALQTLETVLLEEADDKESKSTQLLSALLQSLSQLARVVAHMAINGYVGVQLVHRPESARVVTVAAHAFSMIDRARQLPQEQDLTTSQEELILTCITAITNLSFHMYEPCSDGPDGKERDDAVDDCKFESDGFHCVAGDDDAAAAAAAAATDDDHADGDGKHDDDGSVPMGANRSPACRLLCQCLCLRHEEVALESVRALGNYTRDEAMRRIVAQAGVLPRLGELMRSEQDDMVHAVVGTIVNLAAEPAVKRVLLTDRDGLDWASDLAYALGRAKQQQDVSLIIVCCHALHNLLMDDEDDDTEDNGDDGIRDQRGRDRASSRSGPGPGTSLISPVVCARLEGAVTELEPSTSGDEDFAVAVNALKTVLALYSSS